MLPPRPLPRGPGEGEPSLPPHPCQLCSEPRPIPQHLSSSPPPPMLRGTAGALAGGVLPAILCSAPGTVFPLSWAGRGVQDLGRGRRIIWEFGSLL